MSCMMLFSDQYNVILGGFLDLLEKGYRIPNLHDEDHTEESLLSFFRSLFLANITAFNECYEGRHSDDVENLTEIDISIEVARRMPERNLFQLVKYLDCVSYQCADWSEFRGSGAGIGLEKLQAFLTSIS